MRKEGQLGGEDSREVVSSRRAPFLPLARQKQRNRDDQTDRPDAQIILQYPVAVAAIPGTHAVATMHDCFDSSTVVMNLYGTQRFKLLKHSRDILSNQKMIMPIVACCLSSRL